MFQGHRLVEALKKRPKLESAVSAGQEVTVDWDGRTKAKILKIDGDKITLKRGEGEEGQIVVTRKEFDDMVMEALTGDALLKEVDDILSSKTAKEIDGTLVDMQTASVISQVAKALSPENKAKFLGKGVVKAAEIAWKLVK